MTDNYLATYTFNPRTGCGSYIKIKTKLQQSFFLGSDKRQPERECLSVLVHLHRHSSSTLQFDRPQPALNHRLVWGSSRGGIDG